MSPNGCRTKQAVIFSLLGSVVVMLACSSNWDFTSTSVQDDKTNRKAKDRSTSFEEEVNGNSNYDKRFHRRNIWKNDAKFRAMQNEQRDNNRRILQLDMWDTVTREVTLHSFEQRPLPKPNKNSTKQTSHCVIPTLERLLTYFHYEKVPFETYQLNADLGQTLPMVRTLPETKPEMCNMLSYDVIENNAGTSSSLLVSVIIPFHNELWAVLLRNIHSVLYYSPPNLLYEIVLVDDLSTRKNLKAPLENYVQWLSSKIRLFRTKQREGLIRARLIGARHATGDILVFLDAHVEVTQGWLEPLVAVIVESDNKTIAVPTVAQIEPSNFVYSLPGFPHFRFSGTFTWELDFVWASYRTPSNVSEHDPYATATMIGCGFAMQRDYFFHLGGFDEGMLIWGGENLEISFRAWSCGGDIKVAPCSVIAHVFRAWLPYNCDQNQILLNLHRLAEVWMDDFRKFFYQTIPMALPPWTKVQRMSLEQRKRLRNSLKCKPFSWYLQNIVKDTVFPPKRNWYLFGQLKNVGNEFCVRLNEADHHLTFETCFFISRRHQFALTRENRLVTVDATKCLTLTKVSKRFDLTMQACEVDEVRSRGQNWLWVDFRVPDHVRLRLRGVDTRRPTGKLVSMASGEFNVCLSTTSGGEQRLSVDDCDDNNISQYFVFTHKIAAKIYKTQAKSRSYI